ncbi:MAG: hypothetical protein P9L92_08280 [Candidatus Electryonea clarkiae]|nr:hypothetical protein [Candidatus Electryonea clarkiae]MDP8285320.1 hypothetical protein [Candidatus Electryonea clarkiae]
MDYINEYEDYIHAFLPPIKGIEFGAVTPKKNHLTVNVAGTKINTDHMEAFLSSDQVAELLPPRGLWHSYEMDFYKGRFPVGIAKGIIGDRYVVVGDAAGLIRPFKGKGINSGILTGIRAAKVMMNEGISKNALKRYHEMCSDLIGDLPYGKILRFLTVRLARLKLIDPMIRMAESNEDMRKILFDLVSADESFKNIYLFMKKKKLISKIGLNFLKNKSPNS